MKPSERLATAIETAITYSVHQKYEYVTPETILLFICKDEVFANAFAECDGDIGELENDLLQYLDRYMEKNSGDSVELSVSVVRALAISEQSALNSGAEEIRISHLIHALFMLKDSHAVYYIQMQDITEVDLLRALTEYEEEDDEEDNETESDSELRKRKSSDMSGTEEDADEDDDEYDEDDADEEERHSGSKTKSGISDYAPCLNDTLVNEKPLIGRETELERTIQVLCRKEKNNPLHIGEPGVGKTAITYGLVRRIKEGNVPEQLKNSRVYALDLGSLLAGTKYRGEFEKRFKKVLNTLEKEENPILFLDEIHNISGAGAVEGGSLDAANLIKSHLAAGHIRFIGATTFEEYKKYFEKDKSLVRRFQNIEVKEPTIEETVKILRGIRDDYETFHEVLYSDEVLEYIVTMSAKHINERFLPDKAIDLMDEAGVYRKLHPTTDHMVGKDVVNTVLTGICRVPVEQVDADDLSGLETLEDRLLKNIFGQKEAVSQVVNAIKFSKAGLLEEDKPLASLLFVGPTGVGKTEIARCLAKELGIKLVRFDMSEYGEKHTVAKLIGAPAGYVGYEEGGLLTEEIRKHPSCVLLLDEIEKAHADIYGVLLQVMDYATLTDNQGRKADFRNVILIMTSNAGANRLGKQGIGFGSTNADQSVLKEEIKNTFQPEFRNRLNRIVMFSAMDDEMGRLVVDKKLRELSALLEKKNIIFSADDDAKKLIAEKGISIEFGAREVDRVIRNEIKPLLVDDILFGSLANGGSLTLSAKDKDFVVNATE